MRAGKISSPLRSSSPAPPQPQIKSKRSSPDRSPASPASRPSRPAGCRKTTQPHRPPRQSPSHADANAPPTSPQAPPTAPATTPATDPSTLTAPSVPGSTRRIVVSITGCPPKACPISDETVSAVASTSAARTTVPTNATAHHNQESLPECMRATQRPPSTTKPPQPSPDSQSPATRSVPDDPLPIQPWPCAAFPAESRQTSAQTAVPAASIRSAAARPQTGPIQKTNSRQTIPPQAAPAGVAARKPHATTANPRLIPTAPKTNSGNRPSKHRQTKPFGSTAPPATSRPPTPTPWTAAGPGLLGSLSAGFPFPHPLPASSPIVIYNQTLSIANTSTTREQFCT